MSTILKNIHLKGNNNRSAYLRRPLKTFAQTFAQTVAQNVAQTFVPLILAILFLTNCAIPSSPTGGPPDKEPPRLISTQPANGTTNFAEQTLSFTFNEYINRQTFQRALSIEPDLNIPYKIDWKRTTATVKFADPLPEETTIIVTLGTDLTDIRSNKLKEPVQIALSTGPMIAKGEIRVRVANYEDGQTQEGRSVFLFRLDKEVDAELDEKDAPDQKDTPFDPTSPPLYVSQTDTAGITKFIALADGLYRPIWIEDRNRSRTWQPDREPAQPFNTPAIEIRLGTTLNTQGEPDSAYTPQVWVYQPDTTAPTLQAVGVTSERRLRLRFSEPVKFEPASFAPELLEHSILAPASTLHIYTIQDSLAQDPFTQAIPLYVLPEDSTVIVAQTVKPLSADSTFWLAQDTGIAETNITDLSGNPWKASNAQTTPTTSALETAPQSVTATRLQTQIQTQTFTGSSTPDQTEIEIIQTSLTGKPNPLITDSLTITYNSLIEPTLVEPRIATLTQQVIDSTQFIWDNQLISMQQALDEEKVTVTTRFNTLIFAPGSKTWPTSPSPTIQLYDPITKSRNPISPNFTDPEQFGDLEIVLQEVEPRVAPLILQLENESGEIVWSQILESTRPIDTLASVAQTESQTQSQAIITTTSLPQGTYRLRYFIDTNSNNRWEQGTLIPFTLPESHKIERNVQIVNGFTGTVEILNQFK